MVIDTLWSLSVTRASFGAALLLVALAKPVWCGELPSPANTLSGVPISHGLTLGRSPSRKKWMCMNQQHQCNIPAAASEGAPCTCPFASIPILGGAHLVPVDTPVK